MKCLQRLTTNADGFFTALPRVVSWKMMDAFAAPVSVSNADMAWLSIPASDNTALSADVSSPGVGLLSSAASTCDTGADFQLVDDCQSLSPAAVGFHSAFHPLASSPSPRLCQSPLYQSPLDASLHPRLRLATGGGGGGVACRITGDGVGGGCFGGKGAGCFAVAAWFSYPPHHPHPPP